MLRRLRLRWTDEALPDVWKDTTAWNGIYGCPWVADNLATLSVWSLFLLGRRTLCLALHRSVTLVAANSLVQCGKWPSKSIPQIGEVARNRAHGAGVVCVAAVCGRSRLGAVLRVERSR